MARRVDSGAAMRIATDAEYREMLGPEWVDTEMIHPQCGVIVRKSPGEMLGCPKCRGLSHNPVAFMFKAEDAA